MKHLSHFLLLLACLVAASSLCIAQSSDAGDQPKAQRGEGDARPSKKTLLLYNLLRMSPEELAELRQTIERIEAMPEEEREEIRQRIARMEQMDPEKLAKLRNRFEAIPKEKRRAMRERWFAMSQEERDEWRRKLREMTPEERAKLAETEGFLPPPLGRGPKKGPPSPGGPRQPE